MTAIAPNARRNYEIAKAVDAGATRTDMARKYGISNARARQIVEAHRERRKRAPAFADSTFEMWEHYLKGLHVSQPPQGDNTRTRGAVYSTSRYVVDPDHEAYNVPLEETEMSIRLWNCCAAMGIKTVGELAGKSDWELLRQPNLGKKSVREIHGLFEYMYPGIRWIE